MRATAHHPDGAIDLSGAHIGGQLGLVEAVLINDTGPALRAENLAVTGGCLMRGLRARSHGGSLGSIWLSGARIGSNLTLTGAVLTSDTGPALNADGLTVASDCFMRGLQARSHGDGQSAIRLLGAHIGAQVDLQKAVLTSDTGPALNADDLAVTGGCFMTGLQARSHGGSLGAIRLSGARIDGQLGLSQAALTSDTGPALNAENLAVTGGCFMTGLQARSHGGSLGAIRLSGARIDGQLGLSQAALTSDTGPALNADGLIVASDCVMAGLQARSHGGSLGAIRLLGARIDGQLDLEQAILVSDFGPSFNADGLTVAGGCFMTGLKARSGSLGAIRLLSAHIDGQLDLQQAILISVSGAALNAQRIRIGDFFMEGLYAGTYGPGVAIDLISAEIRGRFIHSWRLYVLWSNDPSFRMRLDGAVYEGLPDAGVDRWLELLRSATSNYSAQPYRQLAAVVGAEGHDADVRKILMAQRRDQIARAATSRRDQAWGWLTKWTLGYGYQPWRALLCLVAVTILSALLTVGLGAGGLRTAVIPGQQTTTAPTSCRLSTLIVLGIDTALPLVTTSAATTCVPRSTSTGAWLNGLGIAEQVVGWAFATLFVAGFTSAVRKT